MACCTGRQGGELPMRTPLYDVNASRKTVSIALNSELAARALVPIILLIRN